MIDAEYARSRMAGGVLLLIVGVGVAMLVALSVRATVGLLVITSLLSLLVVVLVVRIRLFAESEEELKKAKEDARSRGIWFATGVAVVGLVALIWFPDNFFFVVGIAGSAGLFALGVRILRRGVKAHSNRDLYER